MQSARGLLLLGSCVLCLSACGDDVGRAPIGSAGGTGSLAGSGGVGSAGIGSAGTGTATGGGAVAGAGGSASTGGSAGTGSLGPVDCESLKDHQGWQLLVEIKNEMSQTLHLGPQSMSCDAQSLFEVEDGARRALPALASCRSSCQAAMAGTPISCPLVCPMPTTVTLEQGQSVRVPWDGRFAVPQSLPQQCVTGTVAADASCVSAHQVEPGVFTFSARAGTRRQCLDPSGTCSCGPSTIGGCATPTSLIDGTIVTTELFLMLEPGEPSPSGAPPVVGLVFRDQAE